MLVLVLGPGARTKARRFPNLEARLLRRARRPRRCPVRLRPPGVTEDVRRRPAASLDQGRGARIPLAGTSAELSELARPRTKREIARRPIVVLACVVLLVLGAFGFRNWRHYRQNLPQVVRIGYEEGIPALEAGKFDHAHQLLSEAKAAVDALGGAVDNGEEVRHAADEALIFANLLTDSLETLLDEAARYPQAWADRFDTKYKGRAVIIDATITATPNTAGSNRYELDYLVLGPGQGAREQRYARIDLTGFEAITLAGHKEGDQVIFGAQLAAFQYDQEAQEWRIRFEPKTGVSITHIKALQSMGWPTGEFLPEDRPEEPDQQ